MPINFFNPACQEPVRNDTLFGICDDQNNARAYTNTDAPHTWVARVENDAQKEVVFTAIDNCIEVLRENGDMDNRCDGMLTYTGNIVFIELKDEKSGWIPHAVEQLEVTIRNLGSQNISNFNSKRAFACNKRHPNFHFSHNTLMQEFFNKHRVRLIIQATIKL